MFLSTNQFLSVLHYISHKPEEYLKKIIKIIIDAIFLPYIFFNSLMSNTIFLLPGSRYKEQLRRRRQQQRTNERVFTMCNF